MVVHDGLLLGPPVSPPKNALAMKEAIRSRVTFDEGIYVPVAVVMP